MIKYVLSFILILFLNLSNSQTELKFNLASALILTPNIGIEIQLSEKIGYQLDTSATFFDDIEGSPFQTTQIFNEIRYYPKLKEGKNKRSFFIGGGSYQSNYKYYKIDGNRIYENADFEKYFNQSGEELVYRGGIMLTYKL